jgi:hypothetical protein
VQESDVNALIRAELMSGESLLWSGRPKQGIAFRPSDALLIPFSVLWAGFAVFWTYTASRTGAPTQFWMFGLIFVAVGLYFVFGRFIADAVTRSKTCYGVTSDRILIVSELFGHRVKSLNLRTLSDVTFTNNRNGAGTISFGPMNPAASAFGAAPWLGRGQYQPPSFILDQNIQKVYGIIRDAQKRAH